MSLAMWRIQTSHFTSQIWWIFLAHESTGLGVFLVNSNNSSSYALQAYSVLDTVGSCFCAGTNLSRKASWKGLVHRQQTPRAQSCMAGWWEGRDASRGLSPGIHAPDLYTQLPRCASRELTFQTPPHQPATASKGTGHRGPRTATLHGAH